MQDLGGLLIRMTLDAKGLFNGEYLEEEGQISIGRVKFIEDAFADEMYMVCKVVGEGFA